MKKVYINSVCAITPQKTFDNTQFLEELIEYDANVINVVNPVYKDFIPPAAARRMAKGIKMGVVASKLALKESGLENVDAIITGTGMGCVRDSEKFVSAIIDNDEQFLTPTAFIQSTHNTVGGQIALELGCKGYNFTYVHSGISFESALLDAKMQLELDEAKAILVGGVDELGDHTVAIHKLVNHIKSENINSNALLESKTQGCVFGEGAGFFVLKNEKQESSYAEVVALNTYNTLDEESVNEEAIRFLEENNIEASSIDAIILGNNGDVNFDGYYNKLTSKTFKDIQQIYYKHISGEFNTASSFGLWLGARIIKSQILPEAVKLNITETSKFKTILLYNQYRGKNHSFTILKQC
ncbi:beta-ketoacyl synthase N-terminal-like domain-containing protein [uncultured Lacinutrix sp.]|uniref:beta-ketoacyl synthase N-terminal-like domain-containing protein n=1 Tax=uncultured Lacinutrix sp. TaxID=574032 RepID=UPI002630DCD1|nr:beta-ketoacyl synthase N-terminal-like domain-containing protein [uncultured Lacinutrix sp.]